MALQKWYVFADNFDKTLRVTVSIVSIASHVAINQSTYSPVVYRPTVTLVNNDRNMTG